MPPNSSNPQLPEYYSTRKSGLPGTRDYRVYLNEADKLVSPWHDVPLFLDQKAGIVNMVVEIPRWSNVKMEISKDEFLNPIRQDIKKDKLRYVPNIFPHKGYPWNYGALPQTWEDPQSPDPHTHIPGDDDPLDVCELAGDVAVAGQIKAVKVLGAFAVVDEGETDWKIVVIDVENPLAEQIQDIEHVERHMPGYLETMKEWFCVYKVPDGKGRNEVALGGEVRGREFALTLIQNCHTNWKNILTEPSIQTKATMNDIGIQDNNLANQLYHEEKEDLNHLHIDKVAVEKYHYLSPNWPLSASCPCRTMEV